MIIKLYPDFKDRYHLWKKHVFFVEGEKHARIFHKKGLPVVLVNRCKKLNVYIDIIKEFKDFEYINFISYYQPFYEDINSQINRYNIYSQLFFNLESMIYIMPDYSKIISILNKDLDEFMYFIRGIKKLDIDTARVYKNNTSLCFDKSRDMIINYKNKEKISFFKINEESFNSFVDKTQFKDSNFNLKKQKTKWLYHPECFKVNRSIFSPENNLLFYTDKKTSEILYNKWDGIKSKKGDVTPFFNLFNYCLSDNGQKSLDFLINLISYKFQNPKETFPYGLLFIGKQGTGKSLIARSIGEAFGVNYLILPTSTTINEARYRFCGKLISIYDDINDMELKKVAYKLRRIMTEKYLYTKDGELNINHVFWIMTSNDYNMTKWITRERRFYTIRSDKLITEDIYNNYMEWVNNNGFEHLSYWFIHNDLKGWKPPSIPPKTIEQSISESVPETVMDFVVKQILTYSENPLNLWIFDLYRIFSSRVDSNSILINTKAKKIVKMLEHIYSVPFLSFREVESLFPLLFDYNDYGKYQIDYDTNKVGLISKLRQLGVRVLVNSDNMDGFEYNGIREQYLIIYDNFFTTNIISQKNFNDILRNSVKIINLDDL